VINDLTLYRVKNPARRHGSWDYYEEICTLPAVEALPPINPVCEHAS
jgi:hypothetical protein